MQEWCVCESHIPRQVASELVERYQEAQTVKGTQQFHRFVPQCDPIGVLKVYKLSVGEGNSVSVKKNVKGEELEVCEDKELVVGMFVACIYMEELWFAMIEEMSEDKIRVGEVLLSGPPVLECPEGKKTLSSTTPSSLYSLAAVGEPAAAKEIEEVDLNLAVEFDILLGAAAGNGTMVTNMAEDATGNSCGGGNCHTSSSSPNCNKPQSCPKPGKKLCKKSCKKCKRERPKCEPTPCPPCPVCEKCQQCPSCPVCEKCEKCQPCSPCPACPPIPECKPCEPCPSCEPCKCEEPKCEEPKCDEPKCEEPKCEEPKCEEPKCDPCVRECKEESPVAVDELAVVDEDLQPHPLVTRWMASLAGVSLGAMSGHFGPWLVCQGDMFVTCTSYSSRFQSSWSTKVAGVGSAAAASLLAVAAFMCPLVVMMHLSAARVLFKFRHATLAKVVCVGASVLCGLVSLVFFVIEVFISKSGISYGLVITLSWAFYLQVRSQATHTSLLHGGVTPLPPVLTYFSPQVLSVLMGVVAGVGAGIEFGWSRKLGGDPTVYGRDPEGTAATTISNPSFRDLPRGNGHAKTGSQRNSGRVHRNANGVAMTHFSGQPYMITANGTNGANGHPPRPNGMKLAFDPNRTPLRSSLRKPKPAAPEDAPDSSMGIHNLAFTQSSPVAKKKVRIHTQSTSV
ncbi:hypothetical protein GWK47_018116 [Chionoecetes opilio]|uniref:Uncharacterized protein n=1 Tax=Chionoecetes opilio TaxID=41210 RepID=A0A8J4XR72_CHIOP|nr:hypothetical protein GWK47_018116 [Chionoecetes opilio]